MYSGVQVFRMNTVAWYHCSDIHNHYHLLYFSAEHSSKVYSQLWYQLILITLWKRKGNSKRGITVIPILQMHKQSPRKKRLLTQWVGRWSRPLGCCPALVTQKSHIWVALNADDMQPHISCTSYPGSTLSWEIIPSISQVTQTHDHKIGYCFHIQGYRQDFKDGVIVTVK